MSNILGAHISISGGIHKAVERGVEAGCRAIQIFTQNSNQWKGKIPSPEDASVFRSKLINSGISHVVSHDIYLINLAAATGDVRTKSIAGFREEMIRCEILGIDKIVMHPGSHLGEGESVGIKRIAEAFNELILSAAEYKGLILLETTAGQGTNIGYTFEQLRDIIDSTKFPDKFAICFDTCHTFAAGYDTTTKEGYEETFSHFEKIIGLQALRCFHINDSKKGAGSRVDRHEHIGRGAMGVEPFRFLLNDTRFSGIPMIIETPKGDNEDMDQINLDLLRSLIVSY